MNWAESNFSRGICERLREFIFHSRTKDYEALKVDVDVCRLGKCPFISSSSGHLNSADPVDMGRKSYRYHAVEDNWCTDTTFCPYYLDQLS